MALPITSSSATTHRKSCYSPMPFITYHTKTFLHIGQKLRKKECFIRPTRHIEIPILKYIRISSPRIGADNNHFTSFTAGRKTVHHVFYVPAVHPYIIFFPHTMQQVEHRIHFLFILFETLRKINSIRTLCF